ncbi:vWA domain-containing protein [Nocardioides jishulii]|uniref:VWA domain-containing protein n=1 Tax=Nocardioides jishulii TaxID=2575440 RepID=A0A4U2YRF0_9ACTN|nr:VWA domain-containing protein [Nocardioides jishulii]QCX26155.1 VWA domain-containing protein [Nocardioides jishulii]TKI64046.1 VWA domain-containing protein [Nocardioides jishulii]
MRKTGTSWRTRLVALAVLLTATGTSLHGSAAAQPLAMADGEGQGRTMLVLDASGSMADPAKGGKTKIEAARSALRTVVEGLPDDAEVGLRVFGAKVFSRTDPGSCEDSQLVVPAGVDNRSAMLAEIKKYKPYGETPIPYALREAAKDLGSEGARSLILVSDGESTCDPDPCKVAKDLAKDGIDLRIDVVGLSVSGKAREHLRCIAEAGNGDYFDADDAADIEATLTRVASRAAQPFTLFGEPISGGTEQDPTPITVGSWIDTIGTVKGYDAKYYSFERKEAGSTLRVAAVTQGGTGFNDVTRMEITNPEGDRCDYAYTVRSSMHALLLKGVQVTAGAESNCDLPGTYRVMVERSHGTPDVKIGLRVTEEPPVEDDGFVAPEGDVPIEKPAFGGTAQEVAGAASLEEAPELTSGLWSSDIVPGEALIYRFRLDYGQSARVGMRFAAGTTDHREAFGLAPPMAQMSLHSPLGANVDFPKGAEFLGYVGTRAPVEFRTATPQVSRTGAFDGGGFGGGGDFTVAGDYYLMVAVGRNDTLELPFEIDLQIDGEPADGPTYVDGASWTITDGLDMGEAATSDNDTDAETETETDSPAAAEQSSSVSLPVVLGGAAGLLVVGVLVGVLLSRRRARRV